MTGRTKVAPRPPAGSQGRELDAAFISELAESRKTVADFLKRMNPAWNVVGRVR